MGKFTNALLLVVAMDLALVIFLGVAPPGSSLWYLITDVSAWNSLSLISKISGIIAGVGLAAIIIGSLWIKYDFVVFGGLAMVFFSFAQGLWEFYLRINAVPFFAQTIGGTSVTISTLIIAPLIIAYIMLVLNWWRGRD